MKATLNELRVPSEPDHEWELRYADLYVTTQRGARLRICVDNNGDGSDGLRIYLENSSTPVLQINFNQFLGPDEFRDAAQCGRSQGGA